MHGNTKLKHKLMSREFFIL